MASTSHIPLRPKLPSSLCITQAPHTKVDKKHAQSITPMAKIENNQFSQWTTGQERVSVQDLKDILPCVKAPRRDVLNTTLCLSASEMECIKAHSQLPFTHDYGVLKQAQLKMMEEERQAVVKRKRPHLERQTQQIQTDAKAARERLLNPALTTNIGLYDKIKPIDEKIVSSKYQKERDYQVQDHTKTQAERQVEEMRIDKIIESARVQAVEVAKSRAEKRRRQVKVERLGDLEQARKLAAIKSRIQEGLIVRDAVKHQKDLEKLNMEKSRATEENRLQHLHMCRENERICAEAKEAQQKILEEERLAALKNYQFFRQKEIEKEERDLEKKREFEFGEFLRKMIGKQSVNQKNLPPDLEEEKFRQMQLMQDHEWRKQEAEKAREKRDNMAKMRTMQLKDIQEHQQLRILEETRELIELRKFLNLQKEAFKQEQEQQARRRQENLIHGQAVRLQMEPKTFEVAARHKQECDIFEDIQKRNALVRGFKEKKLKELQSVRLERIKEQSMKRTAEDLAGAVLPLISPSHSTTAAAPHDASKKINLATCNILPPIAVRRAMR